MLIAGLRDRPAGANGFASNWVHFGAEQDGRWWHYRQDKHHRWSLDRSQIEQYHLTHVLDPRVRWWEAIELNRRSLQIIERDDGHTIASLVCEDLAHIDDVFDLLREVGPTLVVGLLLDGPQLGSRWMGRYASVLADDPGSAVLTLTSYGMVACAWRNGQPSSSVVALWKDNARGSREITLEPDAQGILLALERQPALRRAADGRLPELTTSDLRLSRVTQLRAAATVPARHVAEGPREPSLSSEDCAVLVPWSEALATAQASNPSATAAVVAEARTGAAWRNEFGVPQPTGALADALDTLAGAATAAGAPARGAVRLCGGR
jgi:hypothetical protein